MKSLNSLTLILALSLLVNISNISAAGHEKKGRKLFNLELADMQKHDVEIMDFVPKAKLTVITFFADYCAPCNVELDSINKKFIGWQNKYNTKFLAVCVSNDKNLDRISAKASSHDWTFNILIDNRNEAMNMLKISHIPYTLIVDESGHIVYEHEGYSVENLENIENIISRGANTDVLANR